MRQDEVAVAVGGGAEAGAVVLVMEHQGGPRQGLIVGLIGHPSAYGSPLGLGLGVAEPQHG